MVPEKNKTRAKSKKISRVKIFLVVRVFEILGSAILRLSAPKTTYDFSQYTSQSRESREESVARIGICRRRRRIDSP
ncbi:hypothetical protein CS546_07480 [Porphyromonas gingivalis]|nr:hypothetical protein CS546_07480 [Porphyromonas gingivalis]ATR96068.1 hypothetical protein CS548_02595 [Porphyromonas gingivalis]